MQTDALASSCRSYSSWLFQGCGHHHGPSVPAAQRPGRLCDVVDARNPALPLPSSPRARRQGRPISEGAPRRHHSRPGSSCWPLTTRRKCRQNPWYWTKTFRDPEGQAPGTGEAGLLLLKSLLLRSRAGQGYGCNPIWQVRRGLHGLRQDWAPQPFPRMPFLV